MKYRIALVEGTDGRLRLRTPGSAAAEVCRVKDACRALRRTRRQVYRYVRDGDIISRGKVLGELLLDRASVDRLANSPLAVWPIPARMAEFFPEYDLSKLNAGRDKTLVVTRVLESGARKDLRWLTRRYSPAELSGVVARDGARLLSPRALRFWSLYFDVKPSGRARDAAWASRGKT